MLLRRMREESYWLPWTRSNRVDGLSVMDCQVTVSPKGDRQQTSAWRTFSSSRSHGIVCETQRNTSVDSCTTLGLRLDRKAALQQFESLPHAVEPKPSVRLFVFGIKAHTAIMNGEMNL